MAFPKLLKLHAQSVHPLANVRGEMQPDTLVQSSGGSCLHLHTALGHTASDPGFQSPLGDSPADHEGFLHMHGLGD